MSNFGKEGFEIYTGFSAEEELGVQRSQKNISKTHKSMGSSLKDIVNNSVPSENIWSPRITDKKYVDVEEIADYIRNSTPLAGLQVELVPYNKEVMLERHSAMVDYIEDLMQQKGGDCLLFADVKSEIDYSPFSVKDYLKIKPEWMSNFLNNCPDATHFINPYDLEKGIASTLLYGCVSSYESPTPMELMDKCEMQELAMFKGPDPIADGFPTTLAKDSFFFKKFHTIIGSACYQD